MNRIATAAATFAIVLAGLAMSCPASAHGKINCGGGPRSGWTDVEALKRKLVAEGWTIKKAHPTRDCYEVYGKTPEGDNVESFFHPVSLKKLLVLKRGRELFRAEGY
jgi:hypothetical protein